eukprot:gene10568-14195_t
MSFRRSMIRMAAKHSDIHPALYKWWSKYTKVDGQVTQHLSPFEQKIVSPMFKDMPAKILKKLKQFLLEAGPGLGCGLCVYFYGDYKYKEIAYHHRS